MKPLLGLSSPVLGLATILSIGAPQFALADQCDDLWYRRNFEFKQSGYCFHTQRGIRAFGNAGCQYDNEAEVPLSPQSRRIVADIVAQEREFGCR